MANYLIEAKSKIHDGIKKSQSNHICIIRLFAYFIH